jgi:uncharacterized membrane-anchored protein YhcB (DUF1043 family)
MNRWMLASLALVAVLALAFLVVAFGPDAVELAGRHRAFREALENVEAVFELGRHRAF